MKNTVCPIQLTSDGSVASEERVPTQSPSRLGAVKALTVILMLLAAFVGQEIMLGRQWVRDVSVWAALPWNDYSVQWIGIIISLGAALIAGAVGSRPVAFQSPHVRPLAGRPSRVGSSIGCALLLLSLGLMYMGQLRFHQSFHRETLYIRMFWLTSCGAFLMANVVWAFSVGRGEQYGSSPRFTRFHYVALFGITALALAFRVYEIGDLPRMLNQDMGVVGNGARKMLTPGNFRLFGCSDTASPQMALLPPTISMFFFGDGLTGLRMTGAILGTIMVAAIYVLVWRSADSHRLASIAALLAAVNLPLIQFSRHIFNLDPWAIFTVAMAFAVHGFRSGRAWPLGIAGLLTGFSLQLYLSIRILALVITAFLILAWCFRSLRLNRPWLAFGLFCLGIIVAWGPNIVDLWTNRAMWRESNRLSSTLLWINNFAEYGRGRQMHWVMEVILERLRMSLALFQVLGDSSGQTTVGSPLVELALAPFMWLGVGVAVFTAKRNPLALFLLTLVIPTLFFGQMISFHGAYWPKLVPVMLAIVVFVTFGYDLVSRALAQLISQVSQLLPVAVAKVKKHTLNLTLCLFTLTIAITGVRAWQKFLAAAPIDYAIASMVGWYVSGFPPGTKVCGIGLGAVNLNHLEVTLVAYKQNRIAIKPETPIPDALAQCGEGPGVWIISPAQPELEAALRAKYPNAPMGESFTHLGGLVVKSLTMP
jgi:hypothetical protein